MEKTDKAAIAAWKNEALVGRKEVTTEGITPAKSEPRKIVFMTESLSDLPDFIKNREDIIVLDNPIILEKPGTNISGQSTSGSFDADSFAVLAEKVENDGYVTKTSLPTIYDSGDSTPSVEWYTRESLEEGYDVIYLATNSAITGSYENIIQLYANEFNDCEGRVLCVDTQCASTGLAFLIMLILDEYDNGKLKTIHDVEKFVLDTRASIGQIFTWDNFTYIRNSGKVSGITASLGHILKIFGVGSVEYTINGQRPLTTLGKVKGRLRRNRRIARFVAETIADENGTIIIAHGNNRETALSIQSFLMELLPNAHFLISADADTTKNRGGWRCGAAIQAHGGPTSIHVNYLRRVPNTYAESRKLFQSLQ
ncbi:DegV family protein [Candidatus Saccharibacteria bacterium]|nr:DegV family protein [Candidatus Saccharibacteria bacterium]